VYLNGRMITWNSRGTGAAVAALILLATGSAVAQRGFGQRGFGQREPAEAPKVHNIPYDGRFTFARIEYETAPGGYYYRGLPAWAHGYPTAELNLMKIMNEVSLLHPHLEGSNVIALDDPALFQYPVAYMTEAGYWMMNDKEAAGLRAYLLKGGFLIFDDFRDDWYRGGGGWQNFEMNMRRVIPNAQFIDLTADNPIFHAFFDIDSLDIIPQYYDQGPPVLRGLFEDNDPSKRMMAMINFNTDVSNFWEFSGEGFVPVDLSNEAYKLGVNYVMYGLTH
jgi:Domain of unknown function (DUF4159)